MEKSNSSIFEDHWLVISSFCYLGSVLWGISLKSANLERYGVNFIELATWDDYIFSFLDSVLLSIGWLLPFLFLIPVFLLLGHFKVESKIYKYFLLLLSLVTLIFIPKTIANEIYKRPSYKNSMAVVLTYPENQVEVEFVKNSHPTKPQKFSIVAGLSKYLILYDPLKDNVVTLPRDKIYKLTWVKPLGLKKLYSEWLRHEANDYKELRVEE
ncbi:membrane hypothetical protein [Vibrio coralliirubri]|uniref:hypothetical protein n=1 Tax=Vibrio coralliirubri TaxID=1516159 RepID=UPI00062F50A7|nr:hypothetical protein [Vibrio coralliirubri]CDU04323.1 membrane hypothetical protein [Vibrio coralliirubri]